MPIGESVVSPGSFCRSCNTPVRWYNNVPIFAWFWLRGKCANCGAKYSFRYPFVEFLMGALFAGAGIAVGFNWTLLEVLIFIFGLVTVSFIDLDHMILPDKFTLSGIVIGLVGASLNPERSFMSALIGVLAGGGFLWAVAYLYYVLRGKEGMGGGDIKLLAWIGAVLGWKAVPVVILVSSLLGSFIGITLSLIQRSRSSVQGEESDEQDSAKKQPLNEANASLAASQDSSKVEPIASKSNKKNPKNVFVDEEEQAVIDEIRAGEGFQLAIPFGPYLAAAAILYVIFDGASWAEWYLALHGL